MTITLIEAEETLAMFAAAADATPVTAIKYEMRRRAHEFRRAVTGLVEAEQEGTPATITPFGIVLAGMYVWHPLSDGDDPWLLVVRQMRQYGQVTLHLERPWDYRGGGGPLYVNFAGESSPVVVQR